MKPGFIVLFACLALTGSAAEQKPNIIFILADDWKLSLCPGSGGWSSPRPPGKGNRNEVNPEKLQKWEWVQLYNLAEDPAETKNLAAENPERVESMTRLVQRYIDEGRSTPGAEQKNTGETSLYPAWILKTHPKL